MSKFYYLVTSLGHIYLRAYERGKGRGILCPRSLVPTSGFGKKKDKKKKKKNYKKYVKKITTK